MKRTLLSFLLTVFTLAAYAQVAKMPLIEHFTQASCGPCASQNPTLKNRLDAFGTSNYVRISHQTSWPGVDPMNAAFPAGPEVRRSYYGVTGVPNTSLNGGAVGGSGTVITSNTLASAAAQTTPYEIVATQTWLNAGEVTVDIQINNTTSNPVSTANRIFVTMVEDHVAYTSAPGSNGETDFEYVMRQMYDATTGAPDATGGAALSTIPANGSVSYSLNVSSLPSYIADKSQVSFAVYLQNVSTGQIQQAAKTTASVPAGTFLVSASSQSVVGAGVCDLTFSPEILISNDDPAASITSAVVEYSINGGTPVQQSYSGNLAPGQSASIIFPTGTLNAGSNSVSQRVVSINGGQNWLRPQDIDISDESFSKLDAVAVNGSLTEGFESGPAEALSRETPYGIFSSNDATEGQFTIIDGPLLGRPPLGGFGNSDRSVIFDFWTITSGTADFIMQKVNLGSNSSLSFSHSYRQYQSTNDGLEIFISTDCGSNWTSLWNQAGATLSTGAPLNNARFFPTTASDWTSNTVDLSAYDNVSDAIIRFRGISDYGNNLYIDDLIVTSTLSNEDIIDNKVTLYPNPADDFIQVAGLESDKKFQIFNIQGALVLDGMLRNSDEIDIRKLSQGLFILKLEGSSAVKFVKK